MPRDGTTQTDSVDLCLEFFRASTPNPTIRNVSTQLGCHFEEVCEMLEALHPAHSDAIYYIDSAKTALKAVANMLKHDCHAVAAVHREDFLDAVCDQMVTAIGSAYMMGMDPKGGFNEVNRSNLSKFDENGDPIRDPQTQKIMKGPNYFKADLKPYV